MYESTSLQKPLPIRQPTQRHLLYCSGIHGLRWLYIKDSLRTTAFKTFGLRLESMFFSLFWLLCRGNVGFRLRQFDVFFFEMQSCLHTTFRTRDFVLNDFMWYIREFIENKGKYESFERLI